MCNCEAIELFSDGPISEYREYNDTDEYNLSVPNDKGYEYWENLIYERENAKDFGEIHEIRGRLLAVDLHSPEFGSFWSKFSETKRNTNLKLKDLFGTYKLHNCSKTLFGEISPVYKNVLEDGTEAYLYKSRIGFNWQVIKPIPYSNAARTF